MSELSWRAIRSFKIRFEEIIANINSKSNDDQSHALTIYHNKNIIRLNPFIIIIPIEKPGAVKIGSLKVDAER